VIARNKINSFKIVIQMLQGLEAIVQSNNVDTSSIVMPIAQKESGFASFFFGLLSKPFDKVQAIVVVCLTVAF
jgi:hypothetical protein